MKNNNHDRIINDLKAKYGDKIDTVKFDIPLMIRLLEYAREDAKTDMDLHVVTENAILLSKDKDMLTMADYDYLVGDKKENQYCGGGKFANGGNIKTKAYEFEYQMLGRLVSDCDYYLGYGNRYEKHLWAGNVNDQIKEMKRLWKMFPKNKKPEWLSMEDILDYEKKMKNKFDKGGSIKKYVIAEGTMSTKDGIIKGKVQWNGFWKRYQVVIDGVIYGEYYATEEEEAIRELENSGFENVKRYSDDDSFSKGGNIVRNKNKNSWNDKFKFYINNNNIPISKGDLVKMAYERDNGIDTAIPIELWDKVDDTSFYVYDYQNNILGTLVDLRQKLKFSNVIVDITIVLKGEVLYDDELPEELKEGLTFHKALDYVFNNDEVSSFTIRPKSKFCKGGNFSQGGNIESKRIDTMVSHWNKYGWAASHVNNDDAEFFKKIGKGYMETASTSFFGTDVKYYDAERVEKTCCGFRMKEGVSGSTFAGGGKIGNNNYFNSVNHFMYFLTNYPDNFMDAFDKSGMKEHLYSKFRMSYEEHGAMGGMFNFYFELSPDHKRELVLWAKDNYTGTSLYENGNISKNDYFNLVNHFMYFLTNYPYNFMDAFDKSGIREHLQNKFNHLYKENGALIGLMSFYYELSPSHQKELVIWAKNNYTGTSYAEGGTFVGKDGKKYTPYNGKVTLIFDKQPHKYDAEFVKDEEGNIYMEDVHLEYGLSSPLFLFVEKKFDDWFDDQDSETQSMYEGSFEEMGGDSYLSKKGAIQQAIEYIDDHLRENNLKHFNLDTDYDKNDFDAAFQYKKGGSVKKDISEKELLEFIKDIDDDNLLSWCGYSSKKEYEDSGDIEYSKENLVKSNFEDLEYVYNDKDVYGLHEFEDGGNVIQKKLYEVTFQDDMTFALQKKQVLLSDKEYESALKSKKNKEVVVSRFDKKNQIHENLMINDIKLISSEIMQKGGGVRAAKQYNREVEKYNWFVCDMQEKKAISGFEFKADANDMLKDFGVEYIVGSGSVSPYRPEQLRYKVIHEKALKLFDIKNPKEKWFERREDGTKYNNGGTPDKITRLDVFKYWQKELWKDKEVYFDHNKEYDTTKMAEDAQDHFKVATEKADTEIEQDIFDWAVDYYNQYLKHLEENQKYKKGGGICPVGMSVQSLIFPKENYTKAQAKSWAKKHQYKNRVDEKENTYRMRQVLPTRFKLNSFRTIELKNTKGIKAVIGCPKSK